MLKRLNSDKYPVYSTLKYKMLQQFDEIDDCKKYESSKRFTINRYLELREQIKNKKLLTNKK